MRDPGGSRRCRRGAPARTDPTLNREDLTPKQLEVVEATDAVTLVLGEAGSGKTTTALWAGREHLLREKTPASRVLFATFSRTAVGQIGRRAGPVFNDLGIRIEVQTFHAVAYRMLRAFGRYDGRGKDTPGVASEAHAKLLGEAGELLSYNDLLPAALQILEAERIRQLVEKRWSLVICDEFQDTTSDQWELLQVLGQSARLLLLADAHQMIYTFIPTVSSDRLAEARDRADHLVELEPASHRDPTGVVPAMARAVRERSFDDDAVSAAGEQDRLAVISCAGDEVPDVLAEEIRRLRREGCRTIGVFETTNAGAATLGAELTDQGINHTLIGLPEAHGQALVAMATMVAYGLDATTFADVRTQLALFLTAATRSPQAPSLAQQLHRDQIASPAFRRGIQALDDALGLAEDVNALARVATGAWENLGVTAGQSTWHRAAATFSALVRQEMRDRDRSSEDFAGALASAADRRHAESLVGEQPVYGSVQVMNCHQTKGREADGVVIVYREDGWVTSRDDREPFTDASRVLYVALTRARKNVTIILPPDPHPLVEPFDQLQ